MSRDKGYKRINSLTFLCGCEISPKKTKIYISAGKKSDRTEGKIQNERCYDVLWLSKKIIQTQLCCKYI